MTCDNANRKCVYSDRTSSERIQLLALSALDTADTPWCLLFHHSLSECPEICKKKTHKHCKSYAVWCNIPYYIGHVLYKSISFLKLEFFMNSYLAPDSESEITSLYSSHVMVACQFSLQAKQKVHPHWRRNNLHETKTLSLLTVYFQSYPIFSLTVITVNDVYANTAVCKLYTVLFTSWQTVGCATPGSPSHIPSQPAIGQKVLVLSTATSVIEHN